MQNSIIIWMKYFPQIKEEQQNIFIKNEQAKWKKYTLNFLVMICKANKSVQAYARTEFLKQGIRIQGEMCFSPSQNVWIIVVVVIC